MKKEKGQQPWNTANYAGGKLKGIAKMLLEKRHVSEVFFQLLGAQKLLDKLFYEQTGLEFRYHINNKAEKLLLSDKLTEKQSKTLENICEKVYSIEYKELKRLYRQVCKIEKAIC